MIVEEQQGALLRLFGKERPSGPQPATGDRPDRGRAQPASSSSSLRDGPAGTGGDVQTFCALTGADQAAGVRALAAARGDVGAAVNGWLDNQSLRKKARHRRSREPGDTQPLEATAPGDRDECALPAPEAIVVALAGGDSCRDTGAVSRQQRCEEAEGGDAVIDLTFANDDDSSEGMGPSRAPKLDPKREDGLPGRVCVYPPGCLAGPHHDGAAERGAALSAPKQGSDLVAEESLADRAWRTQQPPGWLTSVSQEREAALAAEEVVRRWEAVTARVSPPLGALLTDSEFPAGPSSIDGLRDGKGTTEGSPQCGCGAPAKLLRVSRDGPNQGRAFHGCATRSCRFFQWATSAGGQERQRSSGIHWERPSPTAHTVVGSAGFKASHVRQGGVGDCWFLSALSVLAQQGTLVEKLLPTSIGAQGAASLRSGLVPVCLFLDGRWEGLLVDTQLPTRPPAKAKSAAKANNLRPGGLQLAFSRAADGQLWVPLVEKAYAKAHGSYHAISGGHIREGMLDLTGAPTESVALDSSGFDSEEAWARLCSWSSAGFLIGCATSYDHTLKQVGLVGSHAYSVLEVRELQGMLPGVQPTLASAWDPQKGSMISQAKRAQQEYLGDNCTLRLVKVRNPWGRKEWNGDWGAASELWTARLGSALGRTRKDDGEFWMSWHDFLCRFDVIDVCKVHNGWQALTVAIRLQPGSIASAVKVQVESTSPVYISALQPRKRGNTVGYWFTDLSFFLYVRVGNAWQPIGGLLRGPRRCSTLETMLDVGETYLVVAFSAQAAVGGQPHDCCLRFYGAGRLRASHLKISGGEVGSLLLGITAVALTEQRPAAFSRVAAVRLGKGAHLLVLSGHGVGLVLGLNTGPEPSSVSLAAAGQRMGAMLLAGSQNVPLPPRTQRLLAVLAGTSVHESRWMLSWAGEAAGALPSPLPEEEGSSNSDGRSSGHADRGQAQRLSQGSAAAQQRQEAQWRLARRPPRHVLELFSPHPFTSSLDRLMHEIPCQAQTAGVLRSTRGAQEGLGAPVR